MKKIYLILALSAITFAGFAQCTPDPSVNKPGISPAKLADAIAGTPYSEVATLMVPKDTVFVYLGNTYNAVIDSATVVSISDLPAGFAYECDKVSRTWNGGSKGCARLYGNPLAVHVGKYEVVVKVRTFLKITGSPTQFDQLDSSTIDINIVLPNAIQEQFQYAGIKIFPNPVSNVLNVSINQYTSEGSYEIFDLLGQRFNLAPSYSSQTGEVKFDVSNLKPGVYVVKREVNGYIYQSKFVKE
ncbi:MAG: T9SS type A sorting domain-containing protein [bacterium]|nr:T9SS type A sorting domain-containing protein [bacterium]